MTTVTRTVRGNPTNGGVIITNYSNLPEILVKWPLFKKAMAKQVAERMKEIVIAVWESDGALAPRVPPARWELSPISVKIKASRGAPRPAKPLFGMSRTLRDSLETDADVESGGFVSTVRIGEGEHPDARGLTVNQVALMLEFGLSPSGSPSGNAARPKFAWFTKSASIIEGKVLPSTKKSAAEFLGSFNDIPTGRL